jgi:hypothetical protein
MRTEDDLRHVLRQISDEVTDPGLALIGAVHAARRRSRTRPRLQIGLAVAMTAILISAPFMIAGLHRDHASRQVPPVASYDPTAAAALSWATINNAYASSRHPNRQLKLESISIYLHNVALAELTDFAPGSFSVNRIGQRVPVTVDGHAGYFGKVAVLPAPAPYPNETAEDRAHVLAQYAPIPALAWQVGTDQWVVLSGPSTWSLADYLAFAPRLGVRARTQPFLVPFKLTYLPDHWTFTDIEVTDPGLHDSVSGAVASIHLTNGSQTALLRLIPAPSQAAISSGPPVDPASTRKVGSYWLLLDNHTLSDVMRHQLLDSITLASQPGKANSSWFPISTVVP